MPEGNDVNGRGPIGNGIKVAGSIVDALKKEPWSLALVVMNLALLLALFYILISIKEQRAKDVEAIYENQRHMIQLMASCNRSSDGGFKLQSDELRPYVLPSDRHKEDTQ